MVGTSQVALSAQNVFAYFFQVGLGLSLGIALVVLPVVKLATRKSTKNVVAGQKKTFFRFGATKH